ncbi:uncharacterized protein LOC135499997 [Lineus longissimus]|uniref:uncharacterized protein LOC135499997 n=1 Tax=Lineus longissimus TaxID=88925 RepID=UPI002B4F6ECF
MDKSKRKPNFSETEKFRLCEEYEKEFAVITGKFSAILSTKKKHDAWIRITKAMNRRNPSVIRSDADFLKKWQNLCSKMKDEYRDYKKELAKTGGGPPPVEPSLVSQKVASIIGEDDPTVHGIEGGIDSSQAKKTQDVPRSMPSRIQSSKPGTPTRKTPSYTAILSTRKPSAAAAIPNPCPALSDEDTGVAETKKRKATNDDIITMQKELLCAERSRATLEIQKLQLEKAKLTLEMEVLQLKKQKLSVDNQYTTDEEPCDYSLTTL